MKNACFCALVLALLSAMPIAQAADLAVERTYGQTQTACAGTTPSGWAVQSVAPHFSACGGGDPWTLINLNGAPSGAVQTVCAFGSVPSGWETTGTLTTYSECGSAGTGADTAIRIQKT
jgi:hypothetical protein